MENIKLKLDQKDNSEKTSILVVTPCPELGEIICDSLREVVNIEHFSKGSKAISRLRRNENCRQVILDMEMGEVNLLELGRRLRQINPQIEIIIISKGESPTDMDDIQPWNFLHKPFLLQDLQAALDIEPSRDENRATIIDLDLSIGGADSILYWSNNAVLATQYLKRLIHKSFAQEALLIQNQELWSYAGQLPDESVDELKHAILRSCVGPSCNDYVRFIKLKSTRNEYALCVTLVAMGVFLALAFDPDVPFSIFRKQTKELANTLLLLDGNDIPVKIKPCGYLETKTGFADRTSSKNISDYSSSKIEDHDHKEDTFGSSNTNDKIKHLEGLTKQQGLNEAPNVDLMVGSNTQNPRKEPVQFVLDLLGKDEEADCKFSQDNDSQASLLKEFIPDQLYNLTYSCLVIPRFQTYHLTGDRGKMITDCIKRLHISHGWRLESLDIQPEYLRWESSFPPNFAPGKHIDMIRKETSRQLFEDSPLFLDNNPSGDYWAPGYLIVGGKNMISDELVKYFTLINRKKHGILIN